MKLWILRPINEDQGPWVPWYDKAFGFVVRAETEDQARRFAHEMGADENREEKGVNPWMDDSLSTCEELDADGSEGVVMSDFRAG